MAIDPRTPCVIGVAQRTIRPGEGPSPEPLALWEEVTRAAAADAAARSGADAVLQAVDSLQVVYCIAWPYDRPVDRLADALGIAPRHRVYSGIGGTTPQVLVDDAATAILAGDLDVAVITGAEALETKRQAKKAGERLPWSHRDPSPPPFPFEAPFHPAEVAHQVFQAWLTFPVFDIARRARLGVAPDVELSTCRTSSSEVRAEVAMLPIVRLRPCVSASSRYCADSAWARITASECPTTSCTSRASCACCSRSRAISSAWSRSASAVTWKRWETRARSEKRSARPASHGAPSTAVPSTAAVRAISAPGASSA